MGNRGEGPSYGSVDRNGLNGCLDDAKAPESVLSLDIVFGVQDTEVQLGQGCN